MKIYIVLLASKKRLYASSAVKLRTRTQYDHLSRTIRPEWRTRRVSATTSPLWLSVARKNRRIGSLKRQAWIKHPRMRYQDASSSLLVETSAAETLLKIMEKESGYISVLERRRSSCTLIQLLFVHSKHIQEPHDRNPINHQK